MEKYIRSSLFYTDCDILIVLPVSSLQSHAKNLKVDTLKRYCHNIMIRVCKSCGKEFQSFNEGVLYSSSTMGILDFCSDECSKNYLNSVMK
jgi:hypothetical protein